jgi:ATP-dependent exoDNAse (exonuclease V) alpha subunit
MPALTIEQATAALGKACEANGWTLGEEQKSVVHHIANSPDQFIAIRGLAGTGKTFTLNAAREALEANGFEIKGISASGQAAEELGADAKIKDCSTIHHTLNAAEKEAGNALPGQNYETKTTWDFTGLKKSTKPTVWFVDEASLTDNNLFLNIQKMAKLKGNKVVFIGDDRQMPPVGAGNAFANLVQSGKISTVELSNIRRQTDPELLRAVTEAVKGETKVSLDIISKKIQEIPSHSKRMNAIAKDYTSLSSVEREQTLILTATNADRVELNSKIRKQLIKNGELDEGQKFHVETSKNGIEERSFAIKDRIVFLKNDNRLGVKNGTNAVITDVDGNKITAELADHRAITIDTNKYNHIDHAYCQTPHKAQGKTVQRAIINMDSRDTKLNSKNAFYVDLSRTKSNVKLFCDNRVKLDPQISSFCHKITSQDFKRPMKAAHGLKGAKSVKGLTAKNVASMDFGKAWKAGAARSIKGSKGKGFKMPKATKTGIKSLALGNLTAAADLAKFGLSQNIGLATKGLDALNKAWKIIKVPFANNPNWSKVDMSTVKDVAKMTAAANKPKVVDAFTSTAEKDAIANSVQTLERSSSMHR